MHGEEGVELVINRCWRLTAMVFGQCRVNEGVCYTLGALFNLVKYLRQILKMCAVYAWGALAETPIN